MSDYAGDSWAKRWARAEAWNIADGAASPSLRTRCCVYMASAEAADFRILRALKRPSVGFDIDAKAVKAATVRFPEARILNADIRTLYRVCPEGPAIAHLDFCSCISSEMLKTVLFVYAGMPIGSVLIVTALKGREAGLVKDAFLRNRRMRRAIGESVARISDADAGTGRPQETRAIFIKRWLYKHTGKPERLLFSSHYHATSPMFSCVLTVGGPRPMSPFAAASSKLNLRGTQLCVPSVSSESAKDRIRRVCCVATGTDREFLADMYNVSPATISAWRAHNTMGTYRKDAGEEGVPF